MASAAPKLAPFNPTSDACMAIALDYMRQLPETPKLLLDLGCGDGRVLYAAVASMPGLKAVGFEYDAAAVARATDRAAALPADVTYRVQIRHGDAAALDVLAYVRDAGIAPGRAVIFVYVVPAGMAVLLPTLRALVDAGGAVISNVFSVPGWEAAGLLREMRRTETRDGAIAVYRYGCR
jgi:SAM-dependent methyltransferase